MKNNLLKLLFVSLSIYLIPTFTFAENIAIYVKEEAQASSTTIKQVQKELKFPVSKCELTNGLFNNLVDLENKSSTTKIKINDLNKTLEEEIYKRSSIVNTVKNIFTFKRTDKQILEELKVMTQKANDYYEILDTKIIISKDLYIDFECINNSKDNRENLSEQIKVALDLQKEEDKYRKNFSQSLKDKMKIISKEVENKKEKQKEEKREDLKTDKFIEKKTD